MPCVSFSIHAHAQSTQGLVTRQTVSFETAQITSVGQSVYLVGDLPELGSNYIANAIKLVPVAYPIWRTTISLPANRSYFYSYVVRNDGPGQHNATATTVSSIFASST